MGLNYKNVCKMTMYECVIYIVVWCMKLYWKIGVNIYLLTISWFSYYFSYGYGFVFHSGAWLLVNEV